MKLLMEIFASVKGVLYLCNKARYIHKESLGNEEIDNPSYWSY